MNAQIQTAPQPSHEQLYAMNAHGARLIEGVLFCQCGGAEVTPNRPKCEPCIKEMRDKWRASQLQIWTEERPPLAEKILKREATPWPWANLDNPEYKAAVHPKLFQVAQHWRPTGNLVLAGPSGCGKTATAGAACRRILRDAVGAFLAREFTDAELKMDNTAIRYVGLRELEAVESYWTTGTELAFCRRRTALGKPVEAEEKAIKASILVVDEVGFEGGEREVLMSVIDERYRRQLGPSIITTGRKPEEFIALYGDACWRRLTEKGLGSIVYVFPKAEAA